MELGKFCAVDKKSEYDLHAGIETFVSLPMNHLICFMLKRLESASTGYENVPSPLKSRISISSS